MEKQQMEKAREASRNLEIAANGVLDAAREWVDAAPGHDAAERANLRTAVQDWINAGQAFAEATR